jgi:hypothetical protein
MVSTSLKNKKESKNTLNKIHKDKQNVQKDFTQKQIDTICNTNLNTYKSFEHNVEELFKKNKINIVSTSYNLEKEIIRELKQAVNPYGIKANEDFYSYINDRWIKNFELDKSQKYIVQVDDFRLVQDKVYRELIEIIKNYISNTKNENKKKIESVKNAYLSLKKWIPPQILREYSNKFLNYIEEVMKEKSNV